MHYSYSLLLFVLWAWGQDHFSWRLWDREWFLHLTEVFQRWIPRLNRCKLSSDPDVFSVNRLFLFSLFQSVAEIQRSHIKGRSWGSRRRKKLWRDADLTVLAVEALETASIASLARLFYHLFMLGPEESFFPLPHQTVTKAQVICVSSHFYY